jgi:hypothetical protein
MHVYIHQDVKVPVYKQVHTYIHTCTHIQARPCTSAMPVTRKEEEMCNRERRRGLRTCAVSIALGSVLVKIFGGCVHPPSAHLPCMKFPNCSRRDVWVGGWVREAGGGGG